MRSLGPWTDELAREMFEGYPAPTLLVDDDVRLLLANRAARAMLGHESDAGPMLRKRGGEVLHCIHADGPDGCGRSERCKDCVVRGSVRQALAKGGVHRARTFMQLRRPGGEVDVCILVSAWPIGSRGHRHVLLSLENVSDVSLRDEVVRAERELERAHQRAASLARFPEENPDPVLRLAADGTLVYANEAARRHLPSMRLADGHPVPAELAGPARRALEDGRRVDAEVSSGERTLALSFCPIGSEVNVYGEDVTERNRAAAQLAAEKERLAVTLASIGDGVIATDGAARVTIINREARHLTGWTAQAVGKHIGEVFRIVNEETRQPAPCPVERAMREWVVVGLANHTALVARDGTVRPIADSAAPIRDGAGRIVGAVLVFRDQTAEQRAAQALRDSEARLREADQRRRDFLATLSHELRNPLAPIRNSLYVLDRAEPGSEKAARARGVIQRQTQHLARLVDDLLDLNRIAHGKFELRRERVDLGELVRRTSEDYRSLFEGGGVDLRCQEAPGPIWVDVDVTRISQVVGNLLQNAAKFTRRGGSASIATRVAGGRAEVRVRDDGAGMEPGQVERMFEAFAQGEPEEGRASRGLGLGLSIVKGVVELHGGSAWGSSEGRGRGSEFRIELPLAEPPGASPPAPGVPGGGRCSVLVIEDNLDGGQSLVDVLALRGHRVELARDGRTGLALARRLKPDVVLCDLGLPDLDGCQVARAIRADASLRATRLIALSGYAGPGDRQRALEAGFEAHLGKPAAPEDLARLIQGLQ